MSENADYENEVSQSDGGQTAQSTDDIDRRYICTKCDNIVRARWFGAGSFAVGCDCQTVPVVPQMGQPETPEQWQVERPDCCESVDVKNLETIYGGGPDYRCPECGAEYDWDGEMAGAPDLVTVADGGTPEPQDTDMDRPAEGQR